MPKTPLLPGGLARTRHLALSISLSLLLAACNSGGGDSSSSDQPPAVSITSGRQCSGADNSGWCWQKPLPQGNRLADYSFIDEKRGWAVGEAGTILATNDGGVTWQKKNSGVELPLERVVFTNERDGWIVAYNGTILKTGDGGATWVGVASGLSFDAKTFGASDASHAWFQDYSWTGEKTVTRDGGVTWSKRNAIGHNVQKYFPVDAANMWAVAYDSPDQMTLLRTIDDGSTWATVALPLQPMESGMQRYVSDLISIDANHSWLGVVDTDWLGTSRQFYLRTRDAGKSWQALNFNTDDVQFLRFVNANVGFAVSNTKKAVLRTTDGGDTWQLMPFPTDVFDYARALKPLSAKLLLLDDMSGWSHISYDAGTSWQENTNGSSNFYDVTSIWFFDSHEGLAIASDGGMNRTNDGGRTWISTKDRFSAQSGWKRLQFHSSGTGWAIAEAFGILYRSDDKGKNWISTSNLNRSNLYGIMDFHFLDEKRGWAVTEYPSSAQATIFSSNDAGTTWLPVPATSETRGLRSIRFADPLHGVAVGAQGMALVTADGGSKWVSRVTGATGALNRVTFVDANTAIAVGEAGVIVRSTDSGQTWKSIPPVTVQNLNNVYFVSAKVGWAVGDKGVVLATRDGGLSWALQTTSAAANILSAFFVNEQTGWIVGANGMIMATTTGGR